MYIIDAIEHHPSPPISLHKHQIQSLTENVLFLQEFLQGYKSPVSDGDKADPLEMHIADAAYAAEDVIEPHIVDKIQLSRSKATDHDDGPIKLYQDVQNVIEEMDRIKRVAMETNTEKVVVLRDQRRTFASSSTEKNSGGMMVFCDNVLHGIMEKLVADEPGRQVIPITGMGGIGKTALAQTVCLKQLFKERFDICAWAIISQQHNTREILCELLCQATKKHKEQLSKRSEKELGLELYQYLWGRRFLIVMDDMWNIESWDEIERFFPNNGNCSRIMVTTRLSQLSFQLNRDYSYLMKFLDKVDSWVLFSKIVFGEEGVPLELEKIGKEIINNCRGLPLSIVVVGGILKNMEYSLESWESVRNNLTLVVNLDNDKHCLKLLEMSYNHLPVHLKPCFLYMGVFEEDDRIKASMLIKQWLCEGFVKPIDKKSLETIGKGLLKDLVNRNLVLVNMYGSTGNIKQVKVHDLVRHLCVHQSKKEGFYHVTGEYSPRDMNSQRRRIVIRRNTSKQKVLDDLQSMSHARSIICERGEVPRCRKFGLLRAIHEYKFRTCRYENYAYSLVRRNVNLQHLAVEVDSISSTFSSFYRIWNLQTLIVSRQRKSISRTNIWKMPQLRHIENVERRLLIPNPPSDFVVMKNLVVLNGARNFKCDKEVVKRIPNLKKLKIKYSGSKEMGCDDYCLSNIKYSYKLESLDIWCDSDFRGYSSLYKLTFPQTLKKFTFSTGDDFEWGMILDKIGWLPRLEKLRSWRGCFGSGKWEIFEGQFPRLKYLGLFSCFSLKHWTAEASIIFPRLEKLFLFGLGELENIPSEIGYIPTLQMIWIFYCNKSAEECGKEIMEEQVDLQGEDLPFRVCISFSRPI